MKNIPTLLFTLWLTAVMSMPYAAEGPSQPPPMFQAVGSISRLDVQGRTLVVNDRPYRIAADVKVHSRKAQFATVSDLSKGTAVGLVVTDTGSAAPLVTDIWVLPPKGHSSFR